MKQTWQMHMHLEAISMKVFLNPGHSPNGNPDPGAVNGGLNLRECDIAKEITDLVEQYQIYPLKIGYDRYSAQYLVQEMKTYGFHMDDCWQGENMTPVIKETEQTTPEGTPEPTGVDYGKLEEIINKGVETKVSGILKLISDLEK